MVTSKECEKEYKQKTLTCSMHCTGEGSGLSCEYDHFGVVSMSETSKAGLYL